MKRLIVTLLTMGLAFMTSPSIAADGEPWMCRYKGYTKEGNYYYIAVKPFDGNSNAQQWTELNNRNFAQALFDQLAPGKRFSGETACAKRPRDFTNGWFKKLLAGEDMFSSRYNTTLAEWRDGRLVELPWPESTK